ncbi:MAG: hypothetical protein JRH07_03030 [Deltaproteobacteria bacterium]|nr:hypothetical protein [Deltaproteobacteria bacterium]MBW2120806.1 hypothetical protein [Deltaproteobacteria bacterium]
MNRNVLIQDKTLLVHLDRCSGCRVCEIVCSAVKNLEREDAFILILSDEKLDVNIPVIKVGCNACGECTRLCPARAIEFMDVGEAGVCLKERGLGVITAPLVGGKTKL